MFHSSVPAGLIDPDGAFKRAWDIGLNFLVLVLFFVYPIPYVLGGYDHRPLDLVFSALLLLDLGLRFFTAYSEKQEFVTDRARIVRHYLRGWFVVDLIAALPLMLIVESLAPDVTRSGPLHYLWLLRTLRLIRLPSLAAKLQDRWLINPSVFRLSLFAVIFLITAHYIALGWILVGAVDKTIVTPGLRYLNGLYWTMTTITTIGYGDITPDRKNHLQLVYTILVQAVGVGLFSFIIGNVASLIANLDVARASYRKKVEEVTSFCRSKRIPAGLQTRILSYYEYMWERHRSILSDQVVGDLPHTLRVEVGLYLNREIIEKVSFFCNTSELFIREIIEALELVTFLPEDFIIQQGEFGDCMYFVNSGQVDVVVSGQTVATLGEGAFFGEAALIKGALRNASVRTRTYCDTYRLSKRAFDSLRARYPEFDAHVQEILETRERETESLKTKE